MAGQQNAEVSPRVMVVEDDPAVQRLLGYVLEAEGFRVIRCGTGAQAIQAFDEWSPDLVLLDLMLPDGDGLEVSRILEAKRPTTRTPVLVVSAKTERGGRESALEAGVDDFIAKPFEPLELVRRIRALCEPPSTKALP